MAIIIILTVMMFGFGSASHQRTQKELCAGNLQKIFLASQVYANDFNGKFPLTNAVTSDQALDLLVPRYSVDTSIFICPGGRDGKIPDGEPIRGRRISYAYYMGRQTNATPEALLSDRQVNASPKNAGDPVFSSDGKSPGNNHHKYGGNFVFTDGSVQATGPTATFSLAFSNGTVLLNPKP